jgi:protein subunit release factor B
MAFPLRLGASTEGGQCFWIDMNVEKEERERVTILSMQDLEVSYFCGSGAGGQARNKVASGVLLRHPESGAIGRASDSRSQHDNKKAAWQRLLKDPRMKFWLAKKVHEVQQGETLERTIENDTKPENLKHEIKDADGKWVEVPPSYFETTQAKEECES